LTIKYNTFHSESFIFQTKPKHSNNKEFLVHTRVKKTYLNITDIDYFSHHEISPKNSLLIPLLFSLGDLQQIKRKFLFLCQSLKSEQGRLCRCKFYRGVDKSLAQPDWKNNWKVSIFRPTRRSLLPRRPGWTDKFPNCFWVACKS